MSILKNHFVQRHWEHFEYVLNIIVIVESESGGVAQNGQVRVEYAHSLQYNESKINFVVSTFSIILFNGISCLLLMIKSTFEEAT